MRRAIWMAKRLPVAALVGVIVTMSGGVAFGGGIERVLVDGNRWKRKHEYINPGDRVRWVNNSMRFHNIRDTNVGQPWNYSRDLPAGERVTKRFNNLGTFTYRCTIHSQMDQGACRGMCGFIHVQ